MSLFEEKPAVIKNKLKVKLSRARSADESIEAEHERPSQIFSSDVEMIPQSNSISISFSDSRGFNQKSSLTSVSTSPFGAETRTAVMAKRKKIVGNRSTTSLHEKEVFIAEKPKNGSFGTACGSKRGPETRLYNQKAKKQKINSRVMQQCGALLEKLMHHKLGLPFNQPVDPVKLGVPDYFDFISEPMDLGTIKYNLDNKQYSCTSEFAADVRLTFSNAMLYNPPDNYVHVWAGKLNGIFDLGWRSLEAKWSDEISKVQKDPISKERLIKSSNVREHCPETAASWSDILPRFSLSDAQKQKLRNDLMELSKKKIPQPLLGTLRKFGLIGQKEEKIEVDFDAFDEETAWRLQKVLKSYLNSGAGKSVDTDCSCGRHNLQKDLHKGSYRSNKRGSVNAKLLVSPVTCTSGSCGDMKSHCSRHNDFTQTSSDVDSERSSSANNSHTCNDGMLNLDVSTNGEANKQMIKSNHDSAGAVITVDEENNKPNSCPTTPAFCVASGEECESNTYDGKLSPSKALRAAKLRSRFVDTILKAQTLLSNGEKVDPLKMKQERERLEKKQREEKARIEAKIKAAETASRMRKETELKLQRQKEREAARMALQKMEKTVEIYENMEILKDLELLSGCFALDYPVCNGSFGGKLLERFGLFTKDDYLEEGEEDEVATGNRDVEEGEIAS